MMRGKLFLTWKNKKNEKKKKKENQKKDLENKKSPFEKIMTPSSCKFEKKKK